MTELKTKIKTGGPNESGFHAVTSMTLKALVLGRDRCRACAR